MSLSVRFMPDQRSPPMGHRHPAYGGQSPNLVLDERTPHVDAQTLLRYGDVSNPFGLDPQDAPYRIQGLRTMNSRSVKSTSRNLSQSARVVPTNLAKVNVLIVGPGAGIGHNGESYWKLKQDSMFTVKVFGRSGMAYDSYPPEWPEGKQAPNLASFAQDMSVNGQISDFDCLIFGSRGGQVVLPCLWQLGLDLPPSIVINGGCALELPRPAAWPAKAVTLLLMGGKDYFRKPSVKPSKFVGDAKNRVPASNNTTALLYVHEMSHMPAADIMDILLKDGICALLAWKSTGQFPAATFQTILAALAASGYHSCLSYKSGGRWHELQGSSPVFSPMAGRERAKSPEVFFPAAGREMTDSAIVFPLGDAEARNPSRTSLPVRSRQQSPGAPQPRSPFMGSPTGSPGYAQSTPDVRSPGQRRPSQVSSPSPHYSSHGYGSGSMQLPQQVPHATSLAAPASRSARHSCGWSMQVSPVPSTGACPACPAPTTYPPMQLTPRSRQASRLPVSQALQPMAVSMPQMLPWVATR